MQFKWGCAFGIGDSSGISLSRQTSIASGMIRPRSRPRWRHGTDEPPPDRRPPPAPSARFGGAFFGDP
jgi:hypothetical protein